MKRVALVILALLGVAACGGDESGPLLVDGPERARAVPEQALRKQLLDASPTELRALLEDLTLERRVAISVLLGDIAVDATRHSADRNAAITASAGLLTPDGFRLCLRRLTTVLSPGAIISDEDQIRMWPYRYALWKAGWASVPWILDWAERSELSAVEVRHAGGLLRDICGEALARALVGARAVAAGSESHGLRRILDLWDEG